MLNLAMVRHKHTSQNTSYVGDRPEDEAAARRAGVRFQWATNWIEQHQAAIASQLVDIH
jgi:D-glycero-D-manno-heptose 1,7-bisphosphate phosphatase